MLSIDERIRIAWPDANPLDVIAIGPLGSRQDTLLFNRKTIEVSTGNVGTSKACFLDTLDAFAQKVEDTYASRISAWTLTAADREKVIRQRAEYRQTIAYLRSLPELEATAHDECPVAYA